MAGTNETRRGELSLGDGLGASSAHPLIRLFEDALGWLDAAGVVHAENDAMTRLLRSVGDAEGSFAELPFGTAADDVRNLLRDPAGGECVACFETADGTRVWRIAIRDDGERRWVRVRDDTELWSARADLRRAERLRCLGDLGAGLLHDLNNLVGAVLGVTDHLARQANDVRTTALLTGLRDTAEAGAELLRRIGRFAGDSTAHGECVPLADLVEDSVELFRKTAILGGFDVDVEAAADVPEVRVPRVDGMHAILELLLFCRARAMPSANMRVELARSVGSERAGGIVRFAIDSLDDGDVAMLRVLENPREGFVSALAHEDRGRQELLLCLLELQTWGARFAIEPREGGACVLALSLPSARLP